MGSHNPNIWVPIVLPVVAELGSHSVVSSGRQLGSHGAVSSGRQLGSHITNNWVPMVLSALANSWVRIVLLVMAKSWVLSVVANSGVPTVISGQQFGSYSTNNWGFHSSVSSG